MASIWPRPHLSSNNSNCAVTMEVACPLLVEFISPYYLDKNMHFAGLVQWLQRGIVNRWVWVQIPLELPIVRNLLLVLYWFSIKVAVATVQ